ncbi:MAG: diacylglycerol kinase family protein [Acidobacteria bacterium]|nr:diacylglycerol kinase family protein [Acidobacteriota bacterium]
MASPPALPDNGISLRAGDRVVLLVNPAARSTGDLVAIASAACTLQQRYKVETIAPSRVDELEAAARAAATSCDAVIVAGGDGTLHRAINAIEGLDVPIGLLPLGTGNDFARALHIPAAPAGAAARILDGHIRQIDLVAVNGRLFCTVGVFGLAAEATLAFDRLLRPGSWSRPAMRAIGGWSYRVAGLTALVSRGSRLERVAIEIPGTSVVTHSGGANLPLRAGNDTVSGTIGDVCPRSISGAFITNTTLLGGGMNVPVDSDMADGQLEIACIEPMPRARLLWAFTCLANGWRVPDGVLSVVRTGRAVITCERRLPFAADGELVCEDRRFEVAVRPGALRVIC